MPYYKDGTPVEIGDVCKGVGYNVKSDDGELKEIVGTVVGIVPGSVSCNIQVAHVVLSLVASAVYPDHRFFAPIGVTGCGPEGGGDDTPKCVAGVSLEYGQCDHFELLHRAASKPAIAAAAGETS